LIKPLAEPAATAPLPLKIQQLLGWSERDAFTPGAFPLRL
jgi:hypothetical protein